MATGKAECRCSGNRPNEGGIGVSELAIILIIVLVIFGAGKLPEIGAGIGRGIKNFKTSITEQEDKSQQLDQGKAS